MSDKTGWEGRAPALAGVALGADGTAAQALRPAKEMIRVYSGYIVSGYWELKRKFQLIESLTKPATRVRRSSAEERREAATLGRDERNE